MRWPRTLVLKSFPKGFALDETHNPHVSILQQSRPHADDLDKVFAAASGFWPRKTDDLDVEADLKYYYIPLRQWPRRKSFRRANRKTCIGCKMNSSKRSGPSRLRPGHPRRSSATRTDATSRNPISYVANIRQGRGGQAIQSARDDRRRNGKIFERDVGGAIPVVHVRAGGRIGLPTWRVRHSQERTQSADADTLGLSPLAEEHVSRLNCSRDLSRRLSNGTTSLFTFTSRQCFREYFWRWRRRADTTLATFAIAYLLRPLGRLIFRRYRGSVCGAAGRCCCPSRS